MSALRETIAALATPVGTAALAVVRVSGPDSLRLAHEIFGKTPPPRVAGHGDYRDRNGTLLDDVVFTFFRGPHSYTGEDSLEISSHGNPFIAQKILEDLFARGCRAAEAGEFTQRAFLSGRMDLSQAEAVMDVIHARSERALAEANRQLRGSLGRRVAALTEGLLDVLARVEAYIDFPDEDLPEEDRTLVVAGLGDVLRDASRLRATSRYGELLRDGIKMVILGAPNAGKSSLLNRLVGRERALVSPEPGTTRDFIEERIMVGPHWFRLIDTAGLNPSPAPLEKLGIQKTLERAAEADLFLLVLDSTAPVPDLSEDLRERMKASPTLVVLNKIDLAPGREVASPVPGWPVIRASAVTGEGLEDLTEAATRLADAFRQDAGEDTVAINARHAAALARVEKALQEAIVKATDAAPPELLASDLRAALEGVGEIAGRIDHERVLDRLFAAFCIGK